VCRLLHVAKDRTAKTFQGFFDLVGSYRYVPVTPKEEDVVMRDRAELDAAMPIYTVGAFEIDSSAQSSQAAGAGAFGVGASASHDAAREVLNRDGDRSSCGKSAAGDGAPPFACGAMLRMQVVPIRFPASSASAGGCRPGLVRKGDACVAVSGDRPKLLDVLQGH
jgi:hypothetical protein